MAATAPPAPQQHRRCAQWAFSVQVNWVPQRASSSRPTERPPPTRPNTRKNRWSAAALEQVAVYKPRESQSEKQSTCGGVKLPPLGVNLSGRLLQRQTKGSHQKVEHQQFTHTQPERLGFSAGNHGQPAVVEKWKVGSHQRSDQHQPDRKGVGHRGCVSRWGAASSMRSRRPERPTVRRSLQTNKEATAWAQSAMRPPGTMPNNSTKAPLSVSTERTSAPASMSAVCVGASKYITLTTRR